MTAAMVEPRWLITTPLARATASGIGTGPAPIISRGSSGRIEESGRTVGHAMLNVSGVPESAEKECRSFIGVLLIKALSVGQGWLSGPNTAATRSHCPRPALAETDQQPVESEFPCGREYRCRGQNKTAIWLGRADPYLRARRKLKSSAF